MFGFQVSASSQFSLYDELSKRFPDATPEVKAALFEPGKNGRWPIVAEYKRNGETHERLLLRREDGKLFDYRHKPKNSPPIITGESAWAEPKAWEASLSKAGCTDFKYKQDAKEAPGGEKRPTFLSERFTPPLSGLVPRKMLPGGAIRRIPLREIHSKESAFSDSHEPAPKSGAESILPSLFLRFPDAPESVRSLPEGFSYAIAKYTNPKGERHERLLVENKNSELFDYRMSKGGVPPGFSYGNAWRKEEGWAKSLGCKDIEISRISQDGSLSEPKQMESPKFDKPASMVESKKAPPSAEELKKEAFINEVQRTLSQSEFDLIEKYSTMYGLDLGLSLAVIYKESSFIRTPKPTSKEAAKHYGLGQLAPTTAAAIKDKNNKYIFTFKDYRASEKKKSSDFSKKDLEELVEAEKNIHASLKYLSDQITKYGLALGLEAYFQGGKPVKEHIEEGKKLKKSYSEKVIAWSAQFNDTIVPLYQRE